MKRFLVFVIICIVTLSLGLTTYYFLRDNEVIIITDSYFEVNKQDTFVVGVEHTNKNPKTEIVFTSLHPEIVDFNPVNRVFEAKKGGRAIIRVTSNKTDFKTVNIEVSVGDGSQGAPFYIKTIEDLLFLGKEEVKDRANDSILNPKDFKSYYILQADLDFATLTSLDPVLMVNNNISSDVYEKGIWLPIGYNALLGEGFSGNFNFNGHAIYNMKIKEGEITTNITNAGLFAVLEKEAVVRNAILKNVEIEGDFNASGAVAGLSHGRIEKTKVLDGSIVNTSLTGYTGGVVGQLEINFQVAPVVEMAYSNLTINSSFVGGGLVGYNNGGAVVSSYSDATLIGEFNTIIGGIVGRNEYKTFNNVNYDAKIKDTYYFGEIDSTTENKGAIIGSNINLDDLAGLNLIRGNYYTSEISGEITAIGGVLNESIDTNKIGVFNKTLAQLKLASTYYSYKNNQMISIYWSFTKTWVLSEEVNNGLPTLNMDSPLIDHGFYNIFDEVSIRNVTDLINIANDLNGVYVIKEDIDLASITDWIPLGYSVTPEGVVINEFTGYLTANINPETGKPFVIKNLSITNPRTVAGLFASIGANGKIQNLLFENINIFTGETVGAVAAVNNGLINNVSVINPNENFFIAATNISKEANIGGIVGINHGTIENAYTALNIQVNSLSNNHTNGGGLVGKNEAIIINSNSKSEMIGNGTYSKYIGGIVGTNNKTIESVYYTGDITTSTSSEQVIVGGIAGSISRSGILKYSYVAYGKYQGFAVGGLVGISRGTVKESYADVVNITARYAGGLAFNISEGIFENVKTQAFMMGIDKNSVKAGFSYFIGYQSNSNYGLLKYGFSAATFDSVGTNYAETYAPVRTEFSFLVKRQAGYIVDSIYDPFGQVLKEQNFVSAFNTDFLIDKADRQIKVTTEHAQGTDSRQHQTFIENNFSTSVWDFTQIGKYPTLINALPLIEQE